MPLTLNWREVFLRLGLSLVAGAILGFNRGERGHAAGLRTTVLVCLAATGSMIQVNFLLALAQEKQSLVTLDLMRLPLGILSGMGFIGGGAILKRGDVVHGVTTAATLWFTTVMGLCFGGGQLALGVVLAGIGLFVLWALEWLERRYMEAQHATLSLAVDDDGPSEDDIRRTVAAADFEVRPPTPAFVLVLVGAAGVRSIRWTPK
jgi:putative Mg2+ transporter-C (MgtC) family protein